MSNLVFGLSVAAVGTLIVFVGLALLIGLIKLVTLFTRGKSAPKDEAKKAPAPIPAPAPIHAPVEEAAAPADDALIAVIAAAVAAAMGEDTGFVVRRVRRISNAPAWQRAGREEQVYSRF